MARITAHFDWSEAEDREGNTMPAEIRANVKRMADWLEIVRAEAGVPLVITSWFRSEEHSIERRKSGGPGAHSTGLAVDVRCRGRDALMIVKAAVKHGVQGLGISQKGAGRYLHLDIADATARRPRPTIWSY